MNEHKRTTEYLFTFFWPHVHNIHNFWYW